MSLQTRTRLLAKHGVELAVMETLEFILSGMLVTMERSSQPHHRPRPSGCIARSQELERERIARLSVEERILMALGLRDRIAGLLPNPRAEQVHDESGRSARGR